MQAIILAAGQGSRLQASHADAPKCLLRFAGRSLLERHLRLLAHTPVTHVTVVVGYEHAQIEAELQRVDSGLQIRTVYNPDYRDGSVVSLWAARDALASGEDILLMDADVLYDSRMLSPLFETTHANCFLFDGDYTPGDEPVKLCVRDGRLVEFRKCLAPDLVYDRSGESVGFFRLGTSMARQLADRTAEYRARDLDHAPHEEALRDLVLARPQVFGFEDVSGVPWLEIDFPEDIQRAENEILPALEEV